MLHKQFCFLDGLQSCFKPVDDSFIQILNTHPKDGVLKEPVYIHYDSPQMRQYLLKCINDGLFTDPMPDSNQKKNLYYQVHPIELHCTCLMPESDLMFKCTKCQFWFHPKYQEVKLNKRQLQISRTVKCLDCRSK